MLDSLANISASREAFNFESIVSLIDDQGGVENVVLLVLKGGTFGADLPSGIWHTVICLEPGSGFFETKRGPYTPIRKEDLAPWAPVEGSQEAVHYLEQLVEWAKR